MNDVHVAGVEAAQREALTRSRALAVALLLVMASVFLATQYIPEPGFWVLLVRAGAEAAMVGALADWFAVTALFRHPFGIPIPHTAIVPRNKDRIGEGLGSFVARNFLEPQLLAHKLRSLDLAGELGAWLKQPEHAEAVADRVGSGLRLLVESIDDEEVRKFVAGALQEKLDELDLAPLLGRVLELLTENGQHHELFTRSLLVARGVLDRNSHLIYEKVEDRTAWWVPATIDRRIAGAILHGVQDLLADLGDRDHPARREFDRSVRELVDKLKTSPRYRAQVEELKADLLGSPAVQGYVQNVWEDLKRLLLRDLSSPRPRITAGLSAAIQALAIALEQDRHMRGRLNRRIEGLVLGLVVPWRAEIGKFIAEVVRSWDARTVSERIELAVGRDLQFIRINGTLVGALVGCLLFLLSTFAFPH